MLPLHADADARKRLLLASASALIPRVSMGQQQFTATRNKLDIYTSYSVTTSSSVAGVISLGCPIEREREKGGGGREKMCFLLPLQED